MLASLSLAGLALAASTVSALPRAGPAALESNHAYRSPSRQIRDLAIDTSEVYAGLGKRWTDTYQGNLTFPYGVASGDRYVQRGRVRPPRAFADVFTHQLLRFGHPLDYASQA